MDEGVDCGAPGTWHLAPGTWHMSCTYRYVRGRCGPRRAEPGGVALRGWTGGEGATRDRRPRRDLYRVPTTPVPLRIKPASSRCSSAPDIRSRTEQSVPSASTASHHLDVTPHKRAALVGFIYRHGFPVAHLQIPSPRTCCREPSSSRPADPVLSTCPFPQHDPNHNQCRNQASQLDRRRSDGCLINRPVIGFAAALCPCT